MVTNKVPPKNYLKDDPDL